MSGNKIALHLPSKHQRTVFIGVLAICILLVVFAEIIRPNQDAKSYTHRLNSASQPLQKCFDKLASTTQLQIYYAPDIPLENKKQDAAAIRKQIDICRKQLADFNKAAEQLMELRLAGYTSTYHDAQVNQRQAYDVIGQSTDVMNQYQSLSTFLANYYQHIEAYLSYVSDINAIDASFINAAQQQSMANQATDLRQRAEKIRLLTAPSGFEETKQETTDIFVGTADGIDLLLTGYKQGNSFVVDSGYEKIAGATSKYDSTVINLPFQQLISSYIPKQVEQLPVKVENLLAAETE